MKIASTIARYLLGAIFFVFGLNGFLHFIPSPPPSGLAGQFIGAMFVTHYLAAVFAVQLAGGALLLANRFVPLALVLLAPVLVNILLFHFCMNVSGAAIGLTATLLWLIVAAGVRTAFSGILQQRVAS
jgi:hypothetical protein